MPGIPGNRVMSGTWGELWRGGEKIYELKSAQAKYSYNKTDIQLCGQMAVDTKVTNVKGTGSFTVAHVCTRQRNRSDRLIEGIDERDIIIIKLDDPDSFGAERVALFNVSYDDETIMDFQAGNVVEKTFPFTFTTREWLDVIDPQ